MEENMGFNWFRLKSQRLTKYDKANSMFEIGHEVEEYPDDYPIASRYAWIILLIAVVIMAIYRLYSTLELQMTNPF